MRFEDFKYERPDIDQIEKDMQVNFDKLQKAANFDEAWDAFLAILETRKHIDTMGNLVLIRHSINTLDEFYDAENDYFDREGPRFMALNDVFFGLLLESSFEKQFREKLGDHFFNTMKLAKKTFSPEIMEELGEEAKLVSQYSKLLASAQIPFEGKERTLSDLASFFQDKDEKLRKASQEAYWGFFKEHEEEFDDIYDQLVKLRHQMAKKLGYENFVQMGYDRMGRTDYNHEDVASFREGVKNHIVPMAQKDVETQRERFGYERMDYYNLPFKYQTGNPKPQGDSSFLQEQAKAMYDEMSPETKEFFQMMLDKNLMDLDQKKGKGPGGYCTFIEDYGVPFIFSNSNGTSDDVDTLTHEVGHAFQVYSARDQLLPEQRFPGMEAAEINSMGMEFIAYPWIDGFFGEETQKYIYDHIGSTISFLPYGVLVDHFQQEVYENPEWSPKERKEAWRRLEKIYNPWKDYSSNDFLELGSFWQRQSHIYSTPFYYIDYCLAQICAMQIHNRLQEDRESMWQDYVELCKLGGTKPFTELLKVAGLKNPFDESVVRETVEKVSEARKGIDASEF